MVFFLVYGNVMWATLLDWTGWLIGLGLLNPWICLKLLSSLRNFNNFHQLSDGDKSSPIIGSWHHEVNFVGVK